MKVDSRDLGFALEAMTPFHRLNDLCGAVQYELDDGRFKELYDLIRHSGEGCSPNKYNLLLAILRENVSARLEKTPELTYSDELADQIFQDLKRDVNAIRLFGRTELAGRTELGMNQQQQALFSKAMQIENYMKENHFDNQSMLQHLMDCTVTKWGVRSPIGYRGVMNMIVDYFSEHEVVVPSQSSIKEQAQQVFDALWKKLNPQHVYAGRVQRSFLGQKGR